MKRKLGEFNMDFYEALWRTTEKSDIFYLSMLRKTAFNRLWVRVVLSHSLLLLCYFKVTEFFFFQAYFRNCLNYVHKMRRSLLSLELYPTVQIHVSGFHLHKVTSITLTLRVFCNSSVETQGRDPERVLTRLSLLVRLVIFILNCLPV